MRDLFNFYVFASLFNVTYISLRQIIHVFRLKFSKSYVIKYNEKLRQSEMKTQEIYKTWHFMVQVFSLYHEMPYYFKITIYKIKKIVYN